jgi:hypothetical protein
MLSAVIFATRRAASSITTAQRHRQSAIRARREASSLRVAASHASGIRSQRMKAEAARLEARADHWDRLADRAMRQHAEASASLMLPA